MNKNCFPQNDNLSFTMTTFSCLCLNRQVPTFAETFNAKVYGTITQRKQDDDFAKGEVDTWFYRRTIK